MPPREAISPARKLQGYGLPTALTVNFLGMHPAGPGYLKRQTYPQ
jgi:hypothetical protein